MLGFAGGGRGYENQRFSDISAGAIGITGPSDLILYKPVANSKFITLRATAGCCPAKFKWSSSSSDKIKFLGATDQAAVVVKPLAASETKDDISVFVTIDGVTSPPKKLTVKRPKEMSHPVLSSNDVEQIRDQVNFYIIRTKKEFTWTLTDQFGDPMANVDSFVKSSFCLEIVAGDVSRLLSGLTSAATVLDQKTTFYGRINVRINEYVTFNSKRSNITKEDARWKENIDITRTTNKAGQMVDKYAIPTGLWSQEIDIWIDQKLTLVDLGYWENEEVNITATPPAITGKLPVKFQ
ncbi:MAG: hypothetical protein HY796_03890 [Elusimicrobia bacterium]|nr:hypothetical protein [Elusimicrobiota bacterium]